MVWYLSEDFLIVLIIVIAHKEISLEMPDSFGVQFRLALFSLNAHCIACSSYSKVVPVRGLQ